jgi:TRAP-type C4-dicarboxylate transport system permease small subunit
MRKALDTLYGASLFCACLAMAVIASLVLVQVLGRVADRVSVLLGMGRLAFAVPSLAEIGGFMFVAIAFLALPYTLRSAGHVRVTLLLRFLGPASDRIATGFVLLVALALMAFASWNVGVQAHSSFTRGSVSYGLIPISLWIPQAIMTFGLGLLAVALLDELTQVLRNRDPAFRAAEKAREDGEGQH